MNRRRLLALSASAAALSLLPGMRLTARAASVFRRRRPTERNWPSRAEWAGLNRATGGNLLAIESPLEACNASQSACDAVFDDLKNPYWIGDQPGVTQTLGWVDAWQTQPSIYAVAATSAADVAAAVDFARDNDLRLVVKGGGHSYLGTSNAPDSLLIWTRHMNDVILHDSFTPKGCAATEGEAAVTLGAGCMWLQAYDAVTTKGGKYVQGGGCTTVGVAGLVQSGGFGSFSKHYGSAASSLLEAEVVTADGHIRIANACTNSDLFWALKGGGGGTFGVVTKITLRLHPLPDFFGGVDFRVKAASDDAFKRLIGAFIEFYAAHLFGDRWGEQVSFRGDYTMNVGMVSYGYETQAAKDVWEPFLAWIAQRSADYALAYDPVIVSGPAQRLWDAAFLQKNIPSSIDVNTAAGAPPGEFWWSGDADQVGQYLDAYESVWLPATLLQPANRGALSDAFFRASQSWGFSLHFNKGLAGAPPEAVAAARDTATNPAVCDAFALAISAAGQGPSYPGIAGHEPDTVKGRRRRTAIHDCVNVLRSIGAAGSYVSESDYFEADWQRSYWGDNYNRLAQIKRRYDPTGLFFTHHGVGSERWSADGFTRLS